MKSKLTWISILLLLILLGFQYGVTLNEHLKTPSSQWSSAQSLYEGKSNYSSIESVKEETGYTVTLKDLQKQDILICDNDLNSCSYDRTISDGATHKYTYNDKKTSYYIEDDQLVLSTDEGRKVIADASNFTVGGEQIAYWNDDLQVVLVDINTLEEVQDFQMAQPVKTGSFIDGQLFILTEDAKSRVLTGYIEKNMSQPLFSFPIKASENLQSIQLFSPEEGKFGILLDVEILAGGGRTKYISYAEFGDEIGQQLQLTKLSFKDAESGSRLEDVRNPYVWDGENENTISFSAGGYDTSGQYATRIYVGDFSGDEMTAYAATKSDELFSRPHLVDQKNVLIFALDGKEKSLSYSSADPVKVANSSHVGEGDVKTAILKLLTLLTHGMILLLVSFLWFLPALGITYGIQAVFRKMYKTISEQTLFYIHSVVLFLIQLIIFTKVFYVEQFVVTIPFLNHVGQLILLLAVCIIISMLPILFIRKRLTEENFNSSIMYVTFTNLVILLIVIGPYFL
ncbi:hypothetical protein ACFOZY_04555 [Chungangia koreensis]|uniref:Uncharacterized protein n=1 Tax=Chungangia koreensis TaxID=752657 RepID=A0ABV8X3U6_9LACT